MGSSVSLAASSKAKELLLKAEQSWLGNEEVRELLSNHAAQPAAPE